MSACLAIALNTGCLRNYVFSGNPYDPDIVRKCLRKHVKCFQSRQPKPFGVGCSMSCIECLFPVALQQLSADVITAGRKVKASTLPACNTTLCWVDIR